MKKISILVLSLILSSVILISPKNLSIASSQNEGEFSLLTYNVAGLPAFISSSSPAFNTRQISPKLNDYDIVLVQEDFYYHRDLISQSRHSYRSPAKYDLPELAPLTIIDFSNPPDAYGDGLNRLSKYPFEYFTRTAWNDCHGVLNSGSDCLTQKGFTFAEHEISPGVKIDIYNLHADANNDKNTGSNPDRDAREKQFEQILSIIDDWSDGRAVIVTGDFNSRFSADGEVNQFIDAGFSDAWVELKNNGNVPEVGDNHDRIDKILYRSGTNIQLDVSDYEVVQDFTNSSGDQLSDHRPVSAIIHYKKSNIPLIGNFNTYHTNTARTTELIHGEKVWKIVTEGSRDYRQNVNFKVLGDPENKVYTFSVWLRADEEHTVTLRLRNKEKTEGGQQSFTVSTEWKKYEITAPFEMSSESLSLYLYPAGYDIGNNGSVYAAGVELLKSNQLLKSSNDFSAFHWWTNATVEERNEPAPIGNDTTVNVISPININNSIYQEIDINPAGKTYTFGIWLKADESHKARIKIQNENFSESEDRVVNVTTEWQYFEVTKKFTNQSDKLTVILWPGDYNGNTDTVYAWGASLIKE
ncbi:phage head spike fiber domain-containing protein [Chengkuizengella axinellae]|uniref:Endonuclease/exonuclease/phosphatase family protein n=1 Tax=Chengkuizengella axinellae TaxID=3064388 RepID=A0ABT9IU76_9BACL|nr:endonuclease/exonuclease/phosphatase family protein [Chengkuizengella sp. 2205SS18-9]MDP5272899.1 endonuclease/exonuclease/phosphatase family protein [Chengkuizengella sp. 2205SS18-9]